MTLAIITSAIMMAFLGSWHCGVMCGPLSCNFKKKNDFVSYHLGRLLSYLIVGTVLYWGIHYFMDAESRAVKIGGSLIFGVLFILFGLNQLNILKSKQLEFKIFKFQFHLLSKFKNLTKQFPIFLGLLTGLFPCAWLYSFLLLSTQMKSWPAAMTLILIFWIAALPAFFVVTRFMQGLIASSPSSYRMISAIVLIFAGVLSIFGHWVDLLFL